MMADCVPSNGQQRIKWYSIGGLCAFYQFKL
jgi:hypothetical protein